MNIIIAVDSSDGNTFVIGAWDSAIYSHEQVKEIITKKYIEDYECEPEFGDHYIELFNEEVNQ